MQKRSRHLLIKQEGQGTAIHGFKDKSIESAWQQMGLHSSIIEAKRKYF